MLVPHRFDRVQAHAVLVVGVVFVLLSAPCLSVFVCCCWLVALAALDLIFPKEARIAFCEATLNISAHTVRKKPWS